MNLAVCPPEILALDTNAETLWRILLRKVGIVIKGEHIEDKRAWILGNFGWPSLAQRLRPGRSVNAPVYGGGSARPATRATLSLT